MPWLKTSDQAAHHPIVIAPLADEDADDSLVNELFGWVARCAVQAAAYETNYVVDLATARSLAGSSERFKHLRHHAVRAGYMLRCEIDGPEGDKVPALRLVEEKDLFHMLRKEEREWETRRRKDTNDRELTVPVRLRDGDQCRYCPRIVNWNDRRGARSATIDHVHGRNGEVSSPDDLVVACRGCNSKKKDLSADEAEMRLRPAPSTPFYSPKTVEFLAKDGITVQPSTDDPGSVEAASAGSSSPEPDPAGSTAGTAGPAADPGSQDAAPEGPQEEDPGSHQAASEGPTANPGSQDAATAGRSHSADKPEDRSRSSPRPRSNLGSQAEGPRFTGSGRDGSGRAKGRDGPRAGLGRDGPRRGGKGRGGSGRGARGRSRGSGRRKGKRR